MMKRRVFIVGGVAALAAPLAAGAQQAGKVYRVGLIAPIPVAELRSSNRFNAFRREMRHRGHKKAIVAVAHSLLVTAYHPLARQMS